MTFLRALVLCGVLLMQSVLAQDPADYTTRAGSRVDAFVHEELNYRLNLGAEAYTYVDFSDQVPEASFAAIRFNPNAFSLVVSEDIGPGMTAEQYAEIVQSAMQDKLDGEVEGEFKG